MDRSVLNPFCREIVERSKFAYLTTINEQGEPETRAMLNLYNREQYPSLQNGLPFPPYEIYMTTNTSSEKMEHIIHNSKSCVYFIIESDWQGVMLNGKIEIVTDPEKKKMIWQDDWIRYYPGDKGYRNSDYSILKLVARYIKGWNGREKFKFATDG